MFANRTARFGPRVQAAILVATLLAMSAGTWLLVDGIATPDKVDRWKAFAGAWMVSLTAEPFGVILALALSRSNDT